MSGLAWAYVVPPEDAVQPVSAVVVLGGHDITQRVRLGQRLALRLHAPMLVSVRGPQDCLNFFGAPVPASISCFRPTPYSTRGEAEYAAATARSRGWTSLLVVTSPDQSQRARLRFTRCFSGPVRMVATDTHLLARLRFVPYEWAATAKALLWQTSC